MTAVYPWTGQRCLHCDRRFTPGEQPDQLGGSWTHPGCTPAAPSMTAADVNADQAMWREYRRRPRLPHRQDRT